MTEPATATAAPPAPAKPAVSRLRTWGAKLLLLFCACGLGLGVLEWGVRRFFPAFNPKAQVPFLRKPGGFALGPPLQTVRQATPKGDYDSLIHFNEDGFRDTKNLRDSRETDWFALGDSYTLGWGVEESERFSNRLEQNLATNGSPARVFNIAIPDNIIGYQRLLKYAESRGAKVRHLIVGICMENDLCDYTDGKSAWDLMPEAGGPATSKKEALRRWFKNHSALYIGLSFTLQKLPVMRRLLERTGVARDIEELSGKNEWNETVLKTSRDELVKLVAGRDALVLIIPSRHLWKGDNQATELRVHEAFVRMARESGVNVVDVKSALEAQGDPLACYFKTDPHWNARGHAVGAAELWKAMRARGGK